MMTLIDSVDISNPLLGGFGYTIYMLAWGQILKYQHFNNHGNSLHARPQ
jgi:hypothetical protein